jgi:hypothetical protein
VNLFSANRWRLSGLFILLLGAWLRVHGLSAMEFKGDEQEALTLAIRLVDQHLWMSPGSWPTHGMLSSNGVANAPLFTWIVAGAWAVTHSPLAIAHFIAIVNAVCLYPLWQWSRRRMDEPRALLTLAVFAVSPFAVMYSRKIWTQDLLLPGVLAVLWGVEWLRSGKPWRGIVLLLTATLVAGQLHQSGPIALALLPLAFAVQFLLDRRNGVAAIRSTKPSRRESAALVVVVGLNLCFWVPYFAYFFQLPVETFANRPRVDVVRPVLLQKLLGQVMPMDFFYWFEPDRLDFLQDTRRQAFYNSAVFLGAPLFVYGLWRWLRAPSSLPVIGVWWACIIAAFALARIPTYPFYILILAPLPAVLAAGGFDGRLQRQWMANVLAGWRVAYVLALLGLTVTSQAWLERRGGAAGDYGVSYAMRRAQARTIVSRLNSRHRGDASALGELRGGEANPRLPCGEIPTEVGWMVRWIDPSQPGIPQSFQLCDGWLRMNQGLVYRWALRSPAE